MKQRIAAVGRTTAGCVTHTFVVDLKGEQLILGGVARSSGRSLPPGVALARAPHAVRQGLVPCGAIRGLEQNGCCRGRGRGSDVG